MLNEEKINKYLKRWENHDYSRIFQNIIYKKKMKSDWVGYCLFVKKDGDWNSWEEDHPDKLADIFDKHFMKTVKEHRASK